MMAKKYVDRKEQLREQFNRQLYIDGQWSIPVDEIDLLNVEHFYFLNQEGMSFNKIAKIFGVSHSWSYLRVKRFAEEKGLPFGGLKKRGQKTTKTLRKVLTQDYLRNQRLSKRQRDEIRAWMLTHGEEIAKHSGQFLSYEQEDNIAQYETSSLMDWRGCLTAVYA